LPYELDGFLREVKAVEAQKKIYADAEFRRRFAAELDRRSVFHDMWERTKIKEVTKPALKSTEWKSVAEVAGERGVAPLDAFFDLAIEDELAVDYMTPLLDMNENASRKSLRPTHNDRI
jgi:N-acyl-D-aspartate/D-glutamate deacylase